MLALAAGLGGAGCAAPGDGGPSCTGDKCDDSGAGWKEQLGTRKDPIATFLRGAEIDDDGMIDTDYGRIVKAIASQQGCPESSIRTYIVSDNLISGVESFPRIVSTVCSDDVTKAADFFIAASFPEEGTDDIDPRRIEMFAWDPETLKYHFYGADPDEDDDRGDKVKLQVEPARCRDCHLTSRDVSSDRMPMTPIMNELTKPWVHWNAEPDAVSFEYEVPPATKRAPHFRDYAEMRQTSAARLEKIVLAGHAKVASARIRERRVAPATVEAAMAMLRPIFCEEQVNYATEDFGSGVISVTVAVPGGIREAYIAASPSGWPWNWLSDGNLRFSASTAEKVVMMPVRGNADIETEKALLSASTLTPHQVLRVRALDWKTPVFSSFRCDLWKDAMDRFEDEPPRLDKAWKNSDAMKFLFEEIMQVGGEALKPAEPENVIALDVATPAKVAALTSALRAGPVAKCPTAGPGSAACSATLQQLGNVIEAHVNTIQSVGRASLAAERTRAVCHVREHFENKPALPDVSCP